MLHGRSDHAVQEVVAIHLADLFALPVLRMETGNDTRHFALFLKNFLTLHCENFLVSICIGRRNKLIKNVAAVKQQRSE